MAGLAKRDRVKTDPIDEVTVGRIIDGEWVMVGDTVRILGKTGLWTVRGFVQSRLVKDGPKVWCIDVYQQMVRTFPIDKVKPK